MDGLRPDLVVTVVVTEAPGDVREAARDWGGGLLAVVGGDGTVNEAIETIRAGRFRTLDVARGRSEDGGEPECLEGLFSEVRIQNIRTGVCFQTLPGLEHDTRVLTDSL